MIDNALLTENYFKWKINQEKKVIHTYQVITVYYVEFF
jgi:hypothetical protein